MSLVLGDMGSQNAQSTLRFQILPPNNPPCHRQYHQRHPRNPKPNHLIPSIPPTNINGRSPRRQRERHQPIIPLHPRHRSSTPIQRHPPIRKVPQVQHQKRSPRQLGAPNAAAPPPIAYPPAGCHCRNSDRSPPDSPQSPAQTPADRSPASKPGHPPAESHYPHPTGAYSSVGPTPLCVRTPAPSMPADPPPRSADGKDECKADSTAPGKPGSPPAPPRGFPPPAQQQRHRKPKDRRKNRQHPPRKLQNASSGRCSHTGVETESAEMHQQRNPKHRTPAATAHSPPPHASTNAAANVTPQQRNRQQTSRVQHGIMRRIRRVPKQEVILHPHVRNDRHGNLHVPPLIRRRDQIKRRQRQPQRKSSYTRPPASRIGESFLSRHDLTTRIAPAAQTHTSPSPPQEHSSARAAPTAPQYQQHPAFSSTRQKQQRNPRRRQQLRISCPLKRIDSM